jgi:hypothetical protein
LNLVILFFNRQQKSLLLDSKVLRDLGRSLVPNRIESPQKTMVKGVKIQVTRKNLYGARNIQEVQSLKNVI